jgi:O-methyltransferase
MSLKRVLRKLIPVEAQVPTHLPKTILATVGYFRLRTWLGAGGQSIPDIELYQPMFSPWLGGGEFDQVYRMIRPHTLVSRDRAHVLWKTLKQATHLPGDFLECGVFRGGTALMAAHTLAEALPSAGQTDRALHLFDSFQGMPTDTADGESFSPGDFNRTSLAAVSKLLSPYPCARLHPGFIPDTFAPLTIDPIAWAHVDVDLYQSVKDCITWIYPRLTGGGFMIFDDYGFPSCSGARRAVDESFAGKPEVPLCLPTGQCLVVKLNAA